MEYFAIEGESFTKDEESLLKEERYFAIDGE
jgi:hypothetical protein